MSSQTKDPQTIIAQSAAPGAGSPVRWWHGWAPLLILPAAVVLCTPPAWPRWAFMWLLALAIYMGCKWLTWRRTPVQGVPLWKHLGYLLAWPGLDAAAFLCSPRALPAKPPASEWLFALGKLIFGAALLFAGARWLPAELPYVTGWVGMVGIVMVLHFGVFHLLSCAWRSGGVEARPLMHWPLVSVSVSEFWGRRWNMAFRDLTHRFFFRPLTGLLGPRRALLAGFVFSGLIHDVVISVPARGGYGGPSVFFLLQGIAIFLERSAMGKRLGLGRGWCGWLFTMVVLLAPVWLLFHPPFVLEIVVPFLKDLGAIG